MPRPLAGTRPCLWWRARVGRVTWVSAAPGIWIRVLPPCRCSLTPWPKSSQVKPMVGIVAASHSPDLARAAVSLALQMVHGPAPRIEIAAGTSDDHLGTDAARVAEAIVAADSGDGVLVIMDL